MTDPVIYHLGRQGEVAGGMTQVVNDYLSWSFPHATQKLIVTRGGGKVRDLRSWLAARRRIRKLRPRSPVVIVCHLSQGGSFIREGLLGVLAYRRGHAVVAQVHGSSFPAFAARHPRLAARVLSRSHVIQVLSQESWNAISRLDVTTEVVLVPNAVAIAEIRPKEKIVAFGGAVTRRKGVDTLLAAWRGVINEDGWTLHVAGPILEPTITADLPDGVVVLGSIPRAELGSLLSRASIAVLPSTDEGMPLFVLEALAAGACVVTTPVGGIPSVIDESNGVLVPPHDVAALSTALSTLMRNSELRLSLSAEGLRTHAARYSADAVIPQLESVWMRAITRAGERT